MHSLYRVAVEVSQYVLLAVMLMATELYQYVHPTKFYTS